MNFNLTILIKIDDKINKGDFLMASLMRLRDIQDTHADLLGNDYFDQLVKPLMEQMAKKWVAFKGL